MNRTITGRWMTVLCSIALAGCASDPWGDKSNDNSGYRAPDSSQSSSTGSGSGSSSSSAMPSSSGSSGMAPSSTASGSGSGLATSGMGSTAMASYGVVQAIDQMQRQDLGLGSGAVGAAAAGGTTSPSGAPVYRVSVRMDDGSSQMIVVDAPPPYKVGDRVRYSDGALTPY
jgi:hypothetical protein